MHVSLPLLRKQKNTLNKKKIILTFSYENKLFRCIISFVGEGTLKAFSVPYLKNSKHTALIPLPFIRIF